MIISIFFRFYLVFTYFMVTNLAYNTQHPLIRLMFYCFGKSKVISISQIFVNIFFCTNTACTCCWEEMIYSYQTANTHSRTHIPSHTSHAHTTFTHSSTYIYTDMRFLASVAHLSDVSPYRHTDKTLHTQFNSQLFFFPFSFNCETLDLFFG